MGVIHSTTALASTVLLATAICTACSNRMARTDDLGSPRRHLYVMNATADSIAVLGFSLDQGSSFQAVGSPEPLQGMGGSRFVDVPAGGCLRDVLVQFVNHNELIYRNFDVCNHDGLRIAAVRQAGSDGW